MLRIILVRHGETDYNKERRIQGGTSDIPLSEIGRKQALALGQRLSREEIAAIYSSPLQRALDTAKAIAGYHSLEVITLPSLKEINVGSLEGVLAATLGQRFDTYLCTNGLQKLPYGGESLEDVQLRAWQTVMELKEKHDGQTIVLVTHYFVVMALICRVLNMQLADICRLRLGTGTLSAFSIDGDDLAHLQYFNDSFHIKA